MNKLDLGPYSGKGEEKGGSGFKNPSTSGSRSDLG
jgi:hypothetical protein